jgi:hypothetical protein
LDSGFRSNTIPSATEHPSIIDQIQLPTFEIWYPKIKTEKVPFKLFNNFYFFEPIGGKTKTDRQKSHQESTRRQSIIILDPSAEALNKQ